MPGNDSCVPATSFVISISESLDVAPTGNIDHSDSAPTTTTDIVLRELQSEVANTANNSGVREQEEAVPSQRMMQRAASAPGISLFNTFAALADTMEKDAGTNSAVLSNARACIPEGADEQHQVYPDMADHRGLNQNSKHNNDYKVPIAGSSKMS